jgi:hypothetical protein
MLWSQTRGLAARPAGAVNSRPPGCTSQNLHHKYLPGDKFAYDSCLDLCNQAVVLLTPRWACLAIEISRVVLALSRHMLCI